MDFPSRKIEAYAGAEVDRLFLRFGPFADRCAFRKDQLQKPDCLKKVEPVGLSEEPLMHRFFALPSESCHGLYVCGYYMICKVMGRGLLQYFISFRGVGYLGVF